jgi:hypothetical protein
MGHIVMSEIRKNRRTMEKQDIKTLITNCNLTEEALKALFQNGTPETPADLYWQIEQIRLFAIEGIPGLADFLGCK